MKVKETSGKVVREYTITGPQRETVESFWKYLVDTKVVDSYEIEEE